MAKTIRSELISAGRLNEVLDAAFGFYKTITSSTRVKMHYEHTDNGVDIVNFVKTSDVRKGISIWLDKLEVEEENLKVLTKEEYKYVNSFNLVVEDKLDMKLHNYAVSCSHRQIPDDKELEMIRVLSILNCTLNFFLTLELFESDIEYEEGSCLKNMIPEGWKCEKGVIY